MNWSSYTSANGGVWPACGQLDGDAMEEVVLGMERYTTNGGWINLRDDAVRGYSDLFWRRMLWSAYDSANGEMRPACGDLDGDGRDEIVVGLGPSSVTRGYAPIFDDMPSGVGLLTYARVGWSAYNTANGETWPAVGNSR